jgi:hypothetical protein
MPKRRPPDEEERVGSSWIQNMPEWKSSACWMGAFNLIVISAGVALIVFSEAVWQDDNIISQPTEFHFRSFATRAMTSFGSSGVITGVLGFIVAGIMGELNRSRQRTNPKRIRLDTGYDIVLMVYLVMLVGCMLAACITASICTYIYHASRTAPATCPGVFSFGDAPDAAGCSIDSTMYTVVHGAIGSKQLYDVWTDIQRELGCCGYWCAGNSGTAAVRIRARNAPVHVRFHRRWVCALVLARAARV